MNESLRERIKLNLQDHNTDYLVNIWQNGETDEWEEEVFAIISEILLDRLGSLPPVSVKKQIAFALIRAEHCLEEGELDQAQAECKAVLQMEPINATALDLLGGIFQKKGELNEALSFYRQALRADPHLEDTLAYIREVEQKMQEAFIDSAAKQHLDDALDFACNDQPQEALAACETAKPLLPDISIAHNYLGLIYHGLGKYELAVEAYQKAAELNPRLSAARVNLADAKRREEEGNYLSFSDPGPYDEQETLEDLTEGEILDSEEPIPQWFFLDKDAYFLTGWAGHRTRYGRSGYDPLESDFEHAHMQGAVFRLLLDRKFRTRNLFYLVFLAFLGTTFIFYGILPIFSLDLLGFFFTFYLLLYPVAGVMIWVNIIKNLVSWKTAESEETGLTFY